jgi:hypothetical protein
VAKHKNLKVFNRYDLASRFQVVHQLFDDDSAQGNLARFIGGLR